MPRGLPPLPIYPLGFDGDDTLYQVYDTAETVIVGDNQPWSDEIPIEPVPVGYTDIWASNGFANISGELLYYDTVETTMDGRVNLLKRCARNLGGSPTKFNASGTYIRGFVIAEHHNQLAQALMNIQDFVGIFNDPRTNTLDYRIRHLEATPVIWDDFACPDVTLFFDQVSSDPAKGTLVKYNIQIQGSYNNFRLDFGDGNYTTSDQSGTHTYSPNATIDPVVTVGNDQCTITETNIERTSQTEPTPATTNPVFSIPITEFPQPPPFIFPSVGPISPILDFPPIVFPCIDISPFSGVNISIGAIDIQVPSFISFSPLSIPSYISISPIDIPSIISFEGLSSISVAVLSPIAFGPAPVISPIAFGPPPEIGPIDINVTITIDNGGPGGTGIPSCISLCEGTTIAPIQVDWGSPPTLNVAFVQQVASSSRQYSDEDMKMMKELGDDYRDFFPESGDSFKVEYSSIGIPSEIKLVTPEFPDIKIRHDLPKEIKLVKGDFQLSDTIKIMGPDVPLPKEIHVINNSLPSCISVVSDIPSVIKIEHDLPNRIVIESIAKIPSVIKIDGSDIPDQIKVVGFPESIELVFPQVSIPLTLDENLEIPMVFKGAPIELKIEMPKWFQNMDEDDDEYPRVKIVPAPCPKR
jgi:hypothetical protein